MHRRVLIPLLFFAVITMCGYQYIMDRAYGGLEPPATPVVLDLPREQQNQAVAESESGAAASYIEAVLNQDAAKLDRWSCQEAQGQRPQDTTLYKLLEKWAVYWGTYDDVSHGLPPTTVRPAGVKFDFYFLSTNKRRPADESSLVLVEVTSPVVPSGGRRVLQLEGTGLTLPVIREDDQWRVCDVGRGDLKVTARAIPDPPNPSVPFSQDTNVFSKDDEFIIQPDGDILVTETMWYAVLGGGGTWGGYGGIALNHSDGITDLLVLGNGEPYQRIGAGSAPRSYWTYSSPDRVMIAWQSPARNVVFQYRIVGGLRIEESGDQFAWRPLFEDRFNNCHAVTATVHLPAPVDSGQLRAATTGRAAAVTYPDPQTVVFSATSLPAGSEMEISVQFPHGLVSAQPPAWQVRDDNLGLTPTPK